MNGYGVTPFVKTPRYRVLGHESLRSAEQAHVRTKQILEAWCDGRTYESIGEEMGITKQRVAQLIQMALTLHGYRGAKRGDKRLFRKLSKLMDLRIARLRKACRTARDPHDPHCDGCALALGKEPEQPVTRCAMHCASMAGLVGDPLFGFDFDKHKESK